MSRAPESKKADPAFTLMEMVMVLVVVGLLVSIVVPRFTEIREDAKEFHYVNVLKRTAASMKLYTKNYGEYPSDFSQLIPNYLNQNICGSSGGSHDFLRP